MFFSDLFWTLFWLSAGCILVVGVVGAFVRRGGGPVSEKASQKTALRRATELMVGVSFLCPFWLAFCVFVAQGPSNNATPGLGGFLALVLGFPILPVFLGTLKVFLDARRASGLS